MKKNIPITIAFGDGIGPEIMAAVLDILKSAQCPLEYQTITIGEKAYHKGFLNGLDPETFNLIENSKAFLKAPIKTPLGKGYKSLNVTLREKFGLFANVRPTKSYHPIIKNMHPEMDVVIIRENEEDIYCGIEYLQSINTAKAHKIITFENCQRIIQFAFEYAKKHNRKKVTCMTKDNILKKTDGLFHHTFNEIAKYYPDIISEYYLIDIGAALLVDEPETFDIIVVPNLYGDILSDITAKMSSSIGMCGASNIGESSAMFEAIHGCAPDIANKAIANPSGLLQGAISMLNFLNLTKYANIIHNAWLVTIELGFHTKDIFQKENSKKLLNTNDFAKKVIDHLGKKPTILKSVEYTKDLFFNFESTNNTQKATRFLVGVDIIIFSQKKLETFFAKISHANEASLHLEKIMNKGVQVWPENALKAHLCDQYRLRFLSTDLKTISQDVITKLIQDFNRIEVEILSTEYLYLINNEKGF
jgi:isocitrate dehydrogenase